MLCTHICIRLYAWHFGFCIVILMADLNKYRQSHTHTYSCSQLGKSQPVLDIEVRHDKKVAAKCARHQIILQVMMVITHLTLSNTLIVIMPYLYVVTIIIIIKIILRKWRNPFFVPGAKHGTRQVMVIHSMMGTRFLSTRNWAHPIKLLCILAMAQIVHCQNTFESSCVFLIWSEKNNIGILQPESS